MGPLDRTSTNFLLAVVTAAVLACLAATGLGLKFRLPEGGGRNPAIHEAAPGLSEAAVERAAGPEAAEPTWLGLSEESIEDIHFYLAVTLLALIVLHLVLHGRWLWVACKGREPKWQRARGVIFVVLAGLLLALALIPFWMPCR